MLYSKTQIRRAHKTDAQLCVCVGGGGGGGRGRDALEGPVTFFFFFFLLISPFNGSYMTSIYDTEHDKPNKMTCAPKRRLRSASAQSDQSLRCAFHG